MPFTPNHPAAPASQTRPAPPRESYHSGCTRDYEGTVNYDRGAVGVRRRCLGRGPRDSATIYLFGRHPRPFISPHKSRLFFPFSSSFATVWPLSFMLSILLPLILPPPPLQPPTALYVYIILLLREMWLQCLMIYFLNWRESFGSNNKWETRMCWWNYWLHRNRCFHFLIIFRTSQNFYWHEFSKLFFLTHKSSFENSERIWNLQSIRVRNNQLKKHPKK